MNVYHNIDVDQSLIKERVLAFFKSYPIMTIAVAKDNLPSSSVVTFHVENDLTCYFVTQKKSFKANILLANDKLSFSVWKLNEMLVQADAKTRLIPHEETSTYLAKIAKSLDVLKDFWPPLAQIADDEYVVFAVKPYWMRVLDLKVRTIKVQHLPFTDVDLTQ